MSFLHPQLPTRVRERLLQYDNFGEVLARLMQIAIAVVFGALYVGAPRTDAMTPFQIVPYNLAAYLAFATFGPPRASRAWAKVPARPPHRAWPPLLDLSPPAR